MLSNEDKYFLNDIHIEYQGVCPNCSHELYNVLPLEPVFASKDACKFIPVDYKIFRNYLTKYKDLLKKPFLYRRDNHRRYHRYLRASDLKIIRDKVFSTKVGTKYRYLADLYNNLDQVQDV